MAVINVNSVSGINSVTAQSTSVTFYNSSGGLADVVGNFNLSPSYATYSEIVGVNTTASTTSGSTSVTLSGSGRAANISNGFSVSGIGITPGTTVSSGGGTVNIVLSQTAGVTTTTNALTFYTNSKVISPGGVGGMLCRAWVNFNGNGTIPIRASYNVRSISDNGAGQYTITFTTPMPDVGYSAIATGGVDVSGTRGRIPYIDDFSFTPTINSIRFAFISHDASFGDPVNACISIFR